MLAGVWDDISNAIGAGGVAASNMIMAADGTPVYNVLNPAYGPGGSVLTPGYSYGPGGSLNASARVSPGILLIGGGLLLFLLMKKR